MRRNLFHAAHAFDHHLATHAVMNLVVHRPTQTPTLTFPAFQIDRLASGAEETNIPLISRFVLNGGAHDFSRRALPESPSPKEIPAKHRPKDLKPVYTRGTDVFKFQSFA